MANLKVEFGRYQYTQYEEHHGLFKNYGTQSKIIPHKVQCVLDCIKNDKYFENKIAHACSENSYAIMNGQECIGAFVYESSFETEAIYQINMHPDFIITHNKNEIKSYYKNCISLIENMLKVMGYLEVKVWLCADDSFIQAYKDCDYKIIDIDTDTYDEEVVLLNRIFK